MITCLDKSNKHILTIKNVIAQKVISDLVDLRNSSNSDDDKNRGISQFLLFLPSDISPKKVNRKFILDVIGFLELKCRKYNSVIFRQFFSACLRYGLFLSSDFESWHNDAVIEMIKSKRNSVSLIKRVLVLNHPINQSVFVLSKYMPAKGENIEALDCLQFDTDNKFILKLQQEILPDALGLSFSEYKRKAKVYFKVFGQSLAGQIPTRVEDFTPDTLRMQVKYFIQMNANKYDLMILKAFYMKLISKYQGIDNTPFTYENGIDYQFLLLGKACQYINEDYHLVKKNMTGMDKGIPLNFDNWCMVVSSKTNNESMDILNLNRYKAVTFADIANDELKDICKRWFWMTDVVLNQKLYSLRIIKDFLNFREKMKNKMVDIHESSIPDSITYQDMMRFYNTYHSNQSNLVTALSSFFRFLQVSKAYPIDDACISYMPARKPNNGKKEQSNNSIPAIPEEDYKKLIKVLQDRCNDSTATSSDKLTYVVFIMMSLTELRSATILSLDIDDVKEYGNGQYCLRGKTKTSGGRKMDFGITPFIYHLLENVVRYTAKYRDEANDNNMSKQKLFLCRNGRIIQENNINRHIKSACQSAGIQLYTMQNIRKTYMTNVARVAHKKGISVMGIPQLFGHKSSETTLKFYTKFSEQEIMMAVSGQKDIVPDSNPYKFQDHIVATGKSNLDKSSLVSNGCGHCRKDKCTIDGLAECLICKYFVTTPDYINLFINYQNEVESILKNEDNQSSLGQEEIEGYQLILRYISMFIDALKDVVAA